MMILRDRAFAPLHAMTGSFLHAPFKDKKGKAAQRLSTLLLRCAVCLRRSSRAWVMTAYVRTPSLSGCIVGHLRLAAYFLKKPRRSWTMKRARRRGKFCLTQFTHDVDPHSAELRHGVVHTASSAVGGSIVCDFLSPEHSVLRATVAPIKLLPS